MKIMSLLQEIWLSKIQAEIFVNIYKFGAKPASSIAKMVGWERTNIYKTLQSMVRQWYIAETLKSWIKHFFVADKNILRNKIEQKQKELNEKYNKLPQLEAELIKLDEKRVSSAPQMRFFEWKSGMTNLFNDMYFYLSQKQYLSIKMFASNTLESQSTSQQSLRDYAKWFFDKIQKNNINVDAYLGNGILMLENLFFTKDISEVLSLPAGNSAINLFLVWSSVYILIHKQNPFGLKIESEELAEVFHFLLKQMDK